MKDAAWAQAEREARERGKDVKLEFIPGVIVEAEYWWRGRRWRELTLRLDPLPLDVAEVREGRCPPILSS